MKSKVDAWYQKLVPAWERRERALWIPALMRVYRGARGRDPGLADFAAAWAYGCTLVRIT